MAALQLMRLPKHFLIDALRWSKKRELSPHAENKKVYHHVHAAIEVHDAC
jgi:hypothetical protein